MAAVSSRPGPLTMALVGGGALLDYRTRCGSTALHRAAEKNNIEVFIFHHRTRSQKQNSVETTSRVFIFIITSVQTHVAY